MTTLRAPDVQLPRAGDVVAGKYRLESVIGTGGMGIVMGAVDMSLGRPVAIKFLSPAKARREGAIPRFLREARSAASIQSQHVVRVFEVGTLPNAAPFIVMEHLRGMDLAQLLQTRGALSIEEAADYVLQACEALGEAHGRGIVHRDLKPQNLFLAHGPDGSACLKVLDFGISKAADDGTPNLTSTDTVMGTPLYMSPEQVRSLKNVDQRADIWALGSILFELLTASPIYDAPSASALCAMIAMDPPIALRARRPMAPAELEAVILRCLHKDPAGRFPDVAALADALAPFASERGRHSATRVSRVVRAGAGPTGSAGSGGNFNVALAGSVPPAPAAAALLATSGVGTTGTGTTMDGSGRASGAPYGPPPYGPPPFPGSAFPSAPPNYPAGMMGHVPPPPTTQSTWQHSPTNTSTRGHTRDASGGSGTLKTVLAGVATGAGILAVIMGVLFFVLRYTDQQKVADAQNADAGAANKGAGMMPTAAPTAAVVPSSTALAARGKDAGVPNTPTAPKVQPQAQRDAGAPVGPAPVNPQPKPNANAELEAEKRTSNGTCEHQRWLLTQNDPKNNDQAKRVKSMVCLRATSPDGTRCQRSVCQSACSMLQDQMCLMQLQNAERNYTPRF